MEDIGCDFLPNYYKYKVIKMPLKLFWKYNDITYALTYSMKKKIMLKLLQQKTLGFVGYSSTVQQIKVSERGNKTFDRLAQYSKEKTCKFK